MNVKLLLISLFLMAAPLISSAKDQPNNCAGKKDTELERCIEISNAFAAGAGVDTKTLSTGIVGIVLTFIIVWGAWLTMSQYQSFSNGEITFYDFLWRVARAIVIIMLFSIFVTIEGI